MVSHPVPEPGREGHGQDSLQPGDRSVQGRKAGSHVGSAMLCLGVMLGL